MNTCPAIINQRLRRAQTLEVRIPISYPRHRQSTRPAVRRPTVVVERQSGFNIASILFQGRPLSEFATQNRSLPAATAQRLTLPAPTIPRLPQAATDTAIQTTQRPHQAATDTAIQTAQRPRQVATDAAVQTTVTTTTSAIGAAVHTAMAVPALGTTVHTDMTATAPNMGSITDPSAASTSSATEIARRSTLVRGTATLGQLIIESGEPGPYSAADIERWNTVVGSTSLAEFRETEAPDNQEYEIELIARIHQRLFMARQEAMAMAARGNADGADEEEGYDPGEGASGGGEIDPGL